MNELIAYLQHEVATLASLLSFSWLLWASGLTLGTVAVFRFARWVVHASWRIGLDRNRRLGWWVTASQSVAVVFVALVLARNVLATAPLLGAVLLIGGAAASVVVVHPQLENLAAGIGLVFRVRLREGDRVTIGDVSGVVRELGLTRIHLRRPDGSAVLVPNRVVNKELVIVEQSRHTARVSVVLDLDEPPSRDVLEQLRRAAILSPFRALGSAVSVSKDSERPTRVSVELQTHSSAVIAVAARQLEPALNEAVRSLKEKLGREHAGGEPLHERVER